MKQLYILFILILFFVCGVYADSKVITTTDANITGHVLEAGTQEHLGYVTIQIKGTQIGTTTDATGHFMMTNLQPGDITLVFSMVGFETKEVPVILKAGVTTTVDTELQESTFAIHDVVVSANKYETKRRETASLVNVLSPLVFESTASSSVSEVLDFQPGLRVEMSCSNCGYPQLRMNGLSGQYSQILMDNRPIFSSLASVYGLEQVPLGMVDRIEVIRGGGSALFGANAIGGVVNIITKEPTGNNAQVQHTSSLIGGRSWDNNTTINASLMTSDAKIGLFVFGVLRDRQAYDHDGDGFSEIPELKSNMLGFRSYFKTSDYSKIVAEYHHMGEKRRGGNYLNKPAHEADLAEQLEHDIHAGSLKYDYYSADAKHFLSAYASTQYIDRQSYFGTNQDLNAYGQSHDWVMVGGAQYRYHMDNCWFMPADLSAGVEANYNSLKDEILGYNRNIEQKTFVYGGYVQNEWKNDKLSMLIGARVEKHNLIKNVVVSPRFNIRYTPHESIVLRASYASGYRAPQAYDEDLHVGAVGGEVSLIIIDPNLKPEYSNSVNVSADWQQRFANWNVNVTLEGFFTQLNNVFILEDMGYDAQGNMLLWRTNSAGARVMGLNMEAGVEYGKKFSMQLGYTLQRSLYIEPVTWSKNENIEPQKRMFRTPDNYGYAMVNYEPIKGLNINLNGRFTGHMLVQHFAGYIDEDREVITPNFWDLGLRVGYDIPLYKRYTLEVNAGVKNILNSFQKDIDQGVDRDASYIYGPALPRTYFVGLNLKI